MTSTEIREKFLAFFEKRGHTIVPSSSLIPSDPSVLLTTAGMQQFKKYYTGEADPIADFGRKNTASVQKSFRTSDIDEVGDERHLTFFEMLGNFSFGGYGKKEAIQYAHEFITKELGLPISYVTIFKGSAHVPRDDESRAVWKSLGVRDIREEGADVFWGPTGDSGPCGPTTEIYCKNGAVQDIEVWNIVFNQYFSTGSREQLDRGEAKLESLPFLGIDTGMGLERLAMIAQKRNTIFETDLFSFIHTGLFADTGHERETRIVADHLRASVFLLSDGVQPSNRGVGYVLRRLIRRAMMQTRRSGFSEKSLLNLVDCVIRDYEFYPELKNASDSIKGELKTEFEKFEKTLGSGIREFFAKFPEWTSSNASSEKIHEIRKISGNDAFYFYQSHGLTLDLIKDLARLGGHIVEINETEFERAMERHREISRAGVETKFKGGLADASEETTRLHTAHHLLLKALQIVLGPQVKQRGSNITPERLRIDFNHGEKLTDEQKREVERIVNEKIRENLRVVRTEMAREEAEKLGAEHEFGAKYPERVSVYSVGPLESAFSMEFCGGPHVERTGLLGAFRILKEEAVSAGVRRIKAVLEK